MRLENCLNVVVIEYMVVVSQQSDSNFIFLGYSFSKSSNNVPIYYINISSKRIDYQQILCTWNFVHIHYFELVEAEYNPSIGNQIGDFWQFFSTFDFLAYGEREHKNSTNCLCRAPLHSLWSWEIWLCSVLEEVLVRHLRCDPQKRLWWKQRPQQATICTILKLFLLFPYHKTYWRQFWWQDPLALSSPLRWT